MASSSSHARWMYDVFLSFRGQTRKSFTDHLYENLCQAGIHTFRDDESIRKGENISAELLKAIEGSKVSIIVFSKNYAQSRWCLDELVKIMECKRDLGQKVLPIFYDVHPSEVRKQTGEFGDALTQHTKLFGNQKIDEWKDALTTAANLSGWDLQTMTNGYESNFIKKIIEEVLKEVNPTYMNVAKYPVGIDSHVSDVLLLLQSQTKDDVRMIGIFGMGGVGKTTLAKAIYNDLSFQRFEGHCFIANIRSEASQHNGLVRLQEKLVCKTLKRKKIDIDNVDKGISLMKERLRSKKLLIVLDDINHISNLEALAGQRDWFGSGSIIIITTRDVRLLSDLGAHEKYKVNTLSIDESLQLLSWHAFDVPVPSEHYAELSERIASYTGGLPLALTVIGSHLRGKSVQEWSDDAERLRKIPHEDIQKFLRISYDALDDDTQNIFLDIASFFIRHDKNDTTMIMKACGFCAESGINILIERCLLTVEFGHLQMHDLVQDMGREIVRKESPRQPGKRSRLIDPKDVYDVLQDNKGTEAIEGMIVNSNMFEDVPLSTKVFTTMVNLQVFATMVNLRILILYGVCLKGSFKHLSNELRLFRLRNCQLSCIQSDFRSEKLVELDLEFTNIKEFQPNMQHFRCLKILNFFYCTQLKKTPDFTGAQNLQKLTFRYCVNLVHVHPSIGSLERLVVLDFYECKKLKELPSSICKLKSLEKLSLDYCEKLKELPNDLGIVGCLTTLNILRLNFNESCVSFEIADISNLRRLKDLNIKNCKGLVEFPGLESLELLNIENCVSLEKIADLSNMRRLKRLKIKNCKRLVELPGLESLESLEQLNIENCVSLEKIADLSNLRRLKRLRIEYCTSLVELPGLESLESLERLIIENGVSLEKIAHLSKLRRLKELKIKNCKGLVELPGLESLESLELLNIKNCVSLEKIADLSNMRRLEKLTIQNCKSLVELPGLKCLESLELLFIENCVSLEKIADLSNMRRLERLEIENCKRLVELPGLKCLESLERLHIENCVSLEKIADLSNMRRLKRLKIENCKRLVELPGLESLESLELLKIENCVSLEKIADLSNLRRLKRLMIEYCTSLVELPGLESLESLERLDIENGVSLEKIADLSKLRRLKELKIKNCKGLVELPSLESLESLERLIIQNCVSLVELVILRAPNLKFLSTRNCVSLERIADISSLKRLESLYIGNCKNLVELPGLENSHESLEDVEMRNCSGLSIPLIEKWFQAHSKGDNVKISFGISPHYLECHIPTLFRHGKYFSIRCFDIGVYVYYDVGVSVRSKTSGAWILNNAKCYMNDWRFEFEVATMMGEVLEVYAEFHAALLKKRVCVFEIHRNTDGEVRFFPSTRG